MSTCKTWTKILELITIESTLAKKICSKSLQKFAKNAKKCAKSGTVCGIDIQTHIMSVQPNSGFFLLDLCSIKTC